MAIPVRSIGFLLMAPAPLVTLVRALLVLLGMQEPSFYWVFFALGGSLSAIGIVLVAVATRSRPAFRWVIVGAAIAIVGHYVLPRTPAGIFGPSFVQVGTGVIVWPWHRLGLAAGGVAAVGAYMRHAMPVAGNLMLFVGAAGLLAAIVAAALANHHMQPLD